MVLQKAVLPTALHTYRTQLADIHDTRTHTLFLFALQLNIVSSSILLAYHILRDVVGEVKRIWASQTRTQEAIQVPNTAEDLADALDGEDVTLMLFGAPWCSFFGTVVLGSISLFMLPGALPPLPTGGLSDQQCDDVYLHTCKHFTHWPGVTASVSHGSAQQQLLSQPSCMGYVANQGGRNICYVMHEPSGDPSFIWANAAHTPDQLISMNLCSAECAS